MEDQKNSGIKEINVEILTTKKVKTAQQTHNKNVKI